MSREIHYNELVTLSKEINSESDSLSEAIEYVDSSISALNLGVSAWIEFDPENALGYCKIGGEWGLAIRHKQNICRFNDAPRDARILAIEFIGELHEELVRESRTLIERLRKAKESILPLPSERG